MKVDRQELATALTWAASATSKVAEALSHIRIETLDGFLTITATDLTVGVQFLLPVSGTIKPILAPASIARQVAALPAETVELKIDKDRLVVSGGATFRLPTQRVDDWPDIILPEDNTWTPPVDFAETFKAVASHSATKSRPILETVHLGTDMAATDSYRLAVVELPDWPGDPILVPHSIGLKGHVDRVTWDRRTVVFETPDGKLWARLVEGSFPKYRVLLAENPVCTVTVNPDALSDALARAETVVDQGRGVVLTPGTDAVTVSFSGTRGEYTEEVDAKVEGETEPAAFNPSFMRDCLAPCGSEARLELWSASKPAMVRSDWWSSLLMPVVQ